jgi:hypothetical protein
VKTGLEVLMMATFRISAKDVLSGKVDLNSLDSRYVALYFRGFVTVGFLDTLLEAADYMAKFGWRLCACFEQYCIMEKER